MVAIAVSEQVALAAIKEANYVNEVSIAAINSPDNIVISGSTDAVKKIATEFAAKNIKTKRT